MDVSSAHPLLSQTLAAWQDAYGSNSSDQIVDFRSLIPGLPTDRLTHLIHPYPAKLISQIPYLFLRNSWSESLTVADPFCGSGTVLLESAVLGVKCIGADTNPLARLISKVKTTPLEKGDVLTQLRRINARVSSLKDCDPPAVVNLEYWYYRSTIEELAKISKAIAGIRSPAMQDFMRVCFSACARKMSRADPRLSVPVRINLARRKKYGQHYAQLKRHLTQLRRANVLATFNEIVRKNSARVHSLTLEALGDVSIYDNARTLSRKVKHESVDLIITSPPYLGAQKYIRSSGLGLGWLGIVSEDGLRPFENLSIGREHIKLSDRGMVLSTGIDAADKQLRRIAKQNSLRASIAHNYLVEMSDALHGMYQMLKPAGRAVIVIGPNAICGERFDTPFYIEQLANKVGLKTDFRLIDHIRSRGLMTKRNKTSGLISSEWVLCLSKQ